MIKQGHIKPIWTEQTLKSLDFTYRDMSESPNGGKDMYVWDDFDAAARYRSMVGMNLASVQSLNMFWDDDPWPDLKNKVYAIHHMAPGMMQPLHGDLYRFYKKSHGIDNIEDIHRVIVFLLDWEMGHIFHCDNQSIDGWQAGDWIMWSGTTRHIAANFGYKPRYTLQITGIF